MDVLREFLEFIESSKPEPVEKLMHRVLLKSRELTGAEAGTIFIVRGRGRHTCLEAADSQNDVIAVKPQSFVLPITTSSIAGYTSATGETVFVENLYDLPASVPFTFDRRFDKRHGYRSRSMLSFPLLNYDRKVVGVVQLINRRVDGSDEPMAFGEEQAGLIVPVNHIVGSAIERADMLRTNQGAERPASRPQQDARRTAGEDRRPPGRDRRGFSAFHQSPRPGRGGPRHQHRVARSPGQRVFLLHRSKTTGCPRSSATRSATRPNSTMSAR